MEGTDFDELGFFRRIVMVGRSVTTVDGQKLLLEDLWTRRISLSLSPDVSLAIPCLEDLIATKRLGCRPKDLEDIRLLLALREERGVEPR